MNNEGIKTYIVWTALLGVFLSVTNVNVVGLTMYHYGLFGHLRYKIAYAVFATIKLWGWYKFYGRVAVILIHDFSKDIHDLRRQGILTRIVRIFAKNHQKIVDSQGQLSAWAKSGEYGASFLCGVIPAPFTKTICVAVCGSVNGIYAFSFLAGGNFINCMGFAFLAGYFQ